MAGVGEPTILNLADELAAMNAARRAHNDPLERLAEREIGAAQLVMIAVHNSAYRDPSHISVINAAGKNAPSDYL